MENNFKIFKKMVFIGRKELHNQDRWGIVPLLSIIRLLKNGLLVYGRGVKTDGRSRGYLENEDPEMAVSVAHSLAKGIKG